MAVSNDIPTLVQLLRRSIVVRGRVGEKASAQVRGLDRDVECGICSDLVANLWAGDHS